MVYQSIDVLIIDDVQFPSVESQFNGVIGDINGDSTLNVLDIVLLVNIILGIE